MKACALLAAGALTLSAQTTLSVREAVTEALAAHPMLAAGTARISASQGLLEQAGLRPNPRLFLQTENLRAHGTPGFRFAADADTFAYVSQLFETSGKRSRRMEAASAAVRRSALERELLSRQIANRVKLAYWNAVSSRKLYELLRENLGTFRQIVEYHEIRVREGAMAEADLLRVRLESERLEIAMSGAALDAERARIQLFQEMGRTQFPSVEFTDDLESIESEAAPAELPRALENRTEMKLARTALKQAQANLRLQQAASKPDLDFLAGYKRTAGFNTMVGGVQINLPVADRNQGNIAAATSETRAAEATLAATEAIVRAEVQAAWREYELRRRQVRETLPALRDHATESSRIALAAYREGGTDLLRLLDAERVRTETQLLYYRTLAEYQQSRVMLETAMGVEP
jgi:cobalt-zinc-cadmium efflux system outer membrane protein